MCPATCLPQPFPEDMRLARQVPYLKLGCLAGKGLGGSGDCGSQATPLAGLLKTKWMPEVGLKAKVGAYDPLC